MAGERLAKMLNDAKEPEGDKTDIVFGEVISTDPLRIRVDNRLELDEDFLILSPMVQEFKITEATGIHYTQIEDQNVVSSVTLRDRYIFRDLQPRDRVRMIRGHKGQLYYVMERTD